MTSQDVDRYIAQFDGRHAALLRALRALVLDALPEAREKISWGMPTYTLRGNVFHFAAHKQHIGIYPGADAIARFQDEIAPRFRFSKGAFQLPLEGEIPEDLIRRILAYNAGADGGRVSGS